MRSSESQIEPGQANAGAGGEDEKAYVGPEDLAGLDPAVALGVPGSFPYTRGVHRTMYRGRLWTMRQFAGFGSACDTNERFK
ncbi:MAG: methylmalonyl-CoA mutase family protein, partial [Phycisphaerae bacterium]